MLYDTFMQEGVPQSVLEILLLPIGLTLLGLVIFMGGWYVENRATKAPWKWIGVLPVLYGIYAGYSVLHEYTSNSVMQGLLPGKKWMIGEWAALIVPVLGLVLILIFHFFNHKLNISFDE